MRAPNGTITEFDPTGSIFTNPNAIDEPGEITGFYVDANGVGHGFLRTPDGTITTFDAPGAGTARGQGTFGVSLTPSGEIEGSPSANGVPGRRSNQGPSPRSTLQARAQGQAKAPFLKATTPLGRSREITSTETT